MEGMSKNLIWVVVGLVILGLAIAGYLYWQSGKNGGLLESTAENLGDASGSVPEINTNPVENEVPELNPVERVNPFKYENPLR